MESSMYADAPVTGTASAQNEETDMQTIPQVDAGDEFAQTRAPDDLFDDEFTPVAEPVQVVTETHEEIPPTPTRQRGARGASQRVSRGRGRGRGRGEAKCSESRDSPSSQPPPLAVEGDDQTPTVNKDAGRSAAVRGDRSGTGGVRKPKLSENELAARLESIKVKNAAREAAHARAEADEASFKLREQQEQTKRVEERKNRRAMDSEREKNRLRKMKAVGGREWDSEKRDEDIVDGQRRGPQFRRGAHGGVSRDAGASESNFEADYSSHSSPRSRGRGPRGSQGRGRGEHYGNASRETPGQPNPTAPKVADFPELPATKESVPKSSQPDAQAASSTPKPSKTGSESGQEPPAELVLKSTEKEKISWAEQMETGSPVTPA